TAAVPAAIVQPAGETPAIQIQIPIPSSYQLWLDRIRRVPRGVSTLPLVAAVFGNREIQIPIRLSYLPCFVV
ncbi:MAG: hypothetical protein JXD22_02155, partial [Sedimentisphaerales bacterium]|nr:hypothetical protein [Sedimentisphaerales bacterium]